MKVTLQILKYKPYIRLTYRPSYTLNDTVELLSNETHKETENDSVEGIAYSKDTAVIMTGQFVTEDQVDIQLFEVLTYISIYSRWRRQR